MKLADVISTMVKYNAIRTRRLELDKQSEEMKAEENMLRELVMKELIGRDKTYLEGHGAKAEIRMGVKAVVADWDTVYHHIQATGEFDLLHKSITLTACRERWEAGNTVPGVDQVQEPTCTISTVKDKWQGVKLKEGK